jgi:hypothetical protein
MDNLTEELLHLKNVQEYVKQCEQENDTMALAHLIIRIKGGETYEERTNDRRRV